MWHVLLMSVEPGARKTSPVEVLFWVGLLIGLTIIGGMLIAAVRKRYANWSETGDDRAEMLEELRRLRKRGELTPEQYEVSRDSLLGRGRPRARPVIKGEIHEDGSILARPGFDLTGSPLPRGTPPHGGRGGEGGSTPPA
ncbi:MAG: SHOCT domain-containing protein [Phycisphaeraceae bacterium]|nr:SHOCT domain-containing protein [Phycisphaeraceae bacterium]MCW5753700.1 SHOCT domain-containing protein [Phycisphaeraceae bacterium]